MKPLRWNFSLRTLFIAISAIAIVLAWIFAPSPRMRQTSSELDLAIYGKGYFQLENRETNVTAYTRYGRFAPGVDGQLHWQRSTEPWVMVPRIHLPMDSTDTDISSTGSVRYISQGVLTDAGQIQLATFACPDRLKEILPGLYEVTADSGVPMTCNPHVGPVGYIQQGWLESDPSAFELPDTRYFLVAFSIVVGWLAWEVRKLSALFDSRKSNVDRDPTCT